MRIIPEVHFSFIDHPFRKPSFVLYFCGCFRNCPGCHSPELQNPYSDLCQTVTTEELISVLEYYIEKFRNKITSIVLLGGDPVLYAKDIVKVFSYLKKKYVLEVVLYTGELFENLDADLKDVVDLVVDGEYQETLKTGSFPASANQRIFIKEGSNWKDITSLVSKKL